MAKKRSPKEIIEKTEHPELEHAWIKYPGEELENITKSSTYVSVRQDSDKIKELNKKHNQKSYTAIHTQLDRTILPEGTLDREGKQIRREGIAFPSSYDLFKFLINKKIKTVVIAQQDISNGKVMGYFFLKKQKETPSERFHLRLVDRLIRNYANTIKSDGDVEGALQKLSKRCHIKYRIVPAEGYELKRGEIGFTMKHKLEGRTAFILMVGSLILSIFFLSSNITGNIIGNLTNSTSNILGVVFLFLWLVGAFLWFRNRKKR